MLLKLLFFTCVPVFLVACAPMPVPAALEPKQRMVTETAVVPPTTPFTTATPPSIATTTPPSTLTAEKRPSTLPTISPPDACPPDQPDNTLPYSPNVADYRGQQFTNLPAGWEDFGGYVVGSDQYGVYLIRKVEQQGSLMLWLEKVVCRHYDAVGGSRAHLEIAAALFLPLEEDTGNGPRFIQSTCWKTADYPADSTVAEKERGVDTLLAIGYFVDYHNAPTEILFAWEINLAAGRFEELPPETVACTGILGL